VDGQEKGEARKEEFYDSGHWPLVEEAPRFATLLQEEFDKPLEEGMSRDLLDGVTEVAEVEIRRQCSRFAYDEQKVVTQVNHWWFDDDTVPADDSSDTYWRGRHSSPAPLCGIVPSMLPCASSHWVPVKLMSSASSAFEGTYKA
jgi:hypothetical protein